MNLLVKSAIRIIVVLASIQTISYVLNYTASILESLKNMELARELLLLICAVIIVAIILYLVWKNAGRIARALVGRVDVNTLTIDSSSLDVYKVGIGLIGVVLIATTVPTFFSLIARYIVNSRNPYYLQDYQFCQDIPYWIQTITKLVIGCFLTFGRKRMIKLIQWVGRGGDPLDEGNKET